MVFSKLLADKFVGASSNKNEPRSDGEMTIFQHFPTLLGASHLSLSQPEIDCLIAKALKVWVDNPKPAESDYVNGWQRKLKKHEQQLFSNLLWLIDKKVKLYLKRLKYKADFVQMANVYLTVGGKNSYIRKHVHNPIDFLSACFYIQTPSGDFCYNNPVQFMTFPIIEDNQPMPEWAVFSRSITPYPGCLLILPPYLPHWTEPNLTDIQRISLVCTFYLLAE